MFHPIFQVSSNSSQLRFDSTLKTQNQEGKYLYEKHIWKKSKEGGGGHYRNGNCCYIEKVIVVSLLNYLGSSNAMFHIATIKLLMCSPQLYALITTPQDNHHNSIPSITTCFQILTFKTINLSFVPTYLNPHFHNSLSHNFF